MASREYYLKQAATCLRLANSLTDGEVARRLREMAAEFQQKARDAESKPTKEQNE